MMVAERPTGRPSKQTPETVANLIDALAEGHTRRAACALAGIGETTLARWLDEDAEIAGFGAFSEAVKHAEHLAEAERVSRIRAAGIGGAVVRRRTVTKRAKDGSETTEVQEELAPPAWQADAWYLERKNRDTWSRPTERETGTTVVIPVQVNITVQAADAI
jgi:hypothetical protein